jgi:hypothetical protein
MIKPHEGSRIFLGVAQPLQYGIRQAVTAPVGERKGFHHHRTNLSFDMVARH